jgi:hypothetical protein
MYGGLKTLTQQIRHKEKRFSYDLPDLSALPPGQRLAMDALIGGGVARTYPEAARMAGMSEGTMLTHVNRVRQRHPALYKLIRSVRLAQLVQRHEDALVGARRNNALRLRRSPCQCDSSSPNLITIRAVRNLGGVLC